MRIDARWYRSIEMRRQFPPRDRWVPAGLAGLAVISYAYVAVLGLVAGPNLWPYAGVPAILIGAMFVLLGMRGGRLHHAAIGNYETVLTIVYGSVLIWTVMLMLQHLERGSAWSLITALAPALPCLYAARRTWRERAGRP